ncbi:hypothetical protein BH09PAT2_BH09PAT2_05700 [soil metagenome]
MFNLKQNLMSMGMTEEEITIYMATLQPDNETVLKLSQHTAIPRTTVYLLIESLIEKGFISEVTEGKKKNYIPAPPDKIVKYATSKKDQFIQVIADLQKNIPSIQALYSYRHDKPQLGYYQGTQEIVKLLKSTLGEEEICLHIMSEAGTDIFSQEIEAYRSAIKGKMITSREIVSDSLTDNHYKKNSESARNQIRCLSKQYSTNVDYILYSEGVIIITYKNSIPMAVEIRDKNIVQFEKIRFNLLWNHPLLQLADK